MTIISDPPVQSVQGKQLTAALALAKILEHDLPDASWYIGYRIPGSLRGRVNDVMCDATPEEVRENLRPYAEFFGAEIVEESEGDDGSHLIVRAVYRDVPVTVRGYLQIGGWQA